MRPSNKLNFAKLKPFKIILWSHQEVWHNVLNTGVYQVMVVVYISLGAHLTYLNYGMSCVSSMSNLNIYRSLMALL